jgi:Uma2 family endonuclease
MPLPPGLVFPEGKPYHEWVRGRFYPKVSPGFAHGMVQAQIGYLLIAWSEGRGGVSTETDTDVSPTSEDTRRYLPDVGYWSYARLRAEGQLGHDILEIPPDLAIEVRSPREDPDYLADKVAAYLAAGSTVALVADPKTRTLTVHEAEMEPVVLRDREPFEHPAFEGLSLVPEAIFAVLDLP